MDLQQILQILQQALQPQQQTSGHLNGGFNRAPGGGLANGGPVQPSPMAGPRPQPQLPQMALPQAPQAPRPQMPQPFRAPQPGQGGPTFQFGGSGIQRPQPGQGGQGFPPQSQAAGPQGPQAPQIPEVGTGNVPGFSYPEQQPLSEHQLSPEIQQLLQQLSSQGVPGQQSPGLPQQPHHNRFSALMRAILPGV